jgi:LPS export ABC transporter protein LptC
MLFRIYIFSFFLISCFFLSCENDLNAVKQVTFKSSDPDERTQNVHLIYSDSGVAKVELNAKLAETYNKPKKIIKFKDGLEINFYSSEGTVESVLTALYGEISQEDGEMIVRDSVRLKNLNKKQILESEELHWNQKTEAIYTDKPVLVRSEGGLFYGEGIKTSQDFKVYEFIKPKGTIKLK